MHNKNPKNVCLASELLLIAFTNNQSRIPNFQEFLTNQISQSLSICFSPLNNSAGLKKSCTFRESPSWYIHFLNNCAPFFQDAWGSLWCIIQKWKGQSWWIEIRYELDSRMCEIRKPYHNFWHQVPSINVVTIRGHSLTTLTRFWLFWPPTPSHKSWQKVSIFWLPTH